MASMAIDVVDKNWRILTGGEKSLSRKGMRLLKRNLHRARGDRCHKREKSSEGKRIAAQRRMTLPLALEELSDDGSESIPACVTPDEFNLQEFNARQVRKQLRKAARAHRRSVRHADLRELDDPQVRETAIRTHVQERHTRERIPLIFLRRQILLAELEELEAEQAPSWEVEVKIFKLQVELYELESRI